MSKPTELPDLDKLEAYATSSKNGDWHATEAMLNMLDEDDVLALVAAARRAQPEGEAPHWGPVRTVGDLVRNLMVLEQDASIVTAFHVDLEGKRRCRAQQGVTISKERVIDGRWIDSSRKDVPHAYVLWAKPDERDPVATLSPLCGAQHAESSKEKVIIIADEQSAVHRVKDMLAAQQAAAPGNSPEIPDGSISAPGTPEVPVECLRCDAEYCARCPVAKQRAAQLDGGQEGSES